MTDARERRRQRAESQKRADVSGAIKKYRIPIIIIVIWAAVIAFNVAQAQGVVPEFGEDCPGHWHPVLHVVVDEQPLRFSHPEFREQRSGFHLHDDSGVLHFHPQSGKCMELETAMGHLAMDIERDAFVVGEQHGAAAGTYELNETLEMRIHVQEWGSDEWRERGQGYLDSQPGDGDRILVSVGQLNDTVIAQHQASVPQVPDNYTPQGGEGVESKFIPMMMTTIFALLAIVLWYNFAKKTW